MIEKFINKQQGDAITALLEGEESNHFRALMNDIIDTINEMPKTYETDGQGDEAVAYLHYFIGNMDWYITEKDMEEDQFQAFGLADLGYGQELGYICIQELIDAGAELDLYFAPKKLKDIKNC